MQLRTTGEAIWASFIHALDSFFSFLPVLLGAIIVLVVGWIIARVVGRLVDRVLRLINFERAVSAAGVDRFVQRANPRWTASGLIAGLARWFVFLLFLQAAANLLRMPQITAIVNDIMLFLPRVVVAVAIVVIGAYFARVVASMVRAGVSRMSVNPEVMARLAQYSILGVAIIAAISQLGIASVIVHSLFIALVASIALAIGLAFGLGGRDVAGRIAQGWYESGRSMSARGGPPAVPPPVRAAGREPPPDRPDPIRAAPPAPPTR